MAFEILPDKPQPFPAMRSQSTVECLIGINHMPGIADQLRAVSASAPIKQQSVQRGTRKGINIVRSRQHSARSVENFWYSAARKRGDRHAACERLCNHQSIRLVPERRAEERSRAADQFGEFIVRKMADMDSAYAQVRRDLLAKIDFI